MSALSFADDLFTAYSQFASQQFRTRRFAPETLQRVIDDITQSGQGLFTVEQVGESFEGRPLRTVKFGAGRRKALLWSQMHGDESTATMALCDILSYVASHRTDERVRQILSELTVIFLPMLNPDGAARHQRRTAEGIDMNRDALALITPEARTLKELQQRFAPDFGFNLHDQELSTVSGSRNLTAIALLAPAFDASRGYNDVRTRAGQMNAFFAAVMGKFVPGSVARYDDAFEPRAFGDNMQAWGTSTMLVESGHMLGDAEKHSIRKLNAVGILSTLLAIATDEYLRSPAHAYEQLPFNGKRAYDVILRNIRIDHGRGKSTPADLGISYQVDTHTEDIPRLVDLGDLHTFIGVKEIDGKGKSIPAAALPLGSAFAWESYF